MDIQKFLCIFLLLCLSGCAQFSSPDFTVGQCVNLPTGTFVDHADTVDCNSLHDAEVFEVAVYTKAETFPGEEQLNAFASERCTAAFEPYVGIPYRESELQITWLVPSAESWDAAADRDAVCLLVGEITDDGHFEQLTEKKQGSER